MTFSSKKDLQDAIKTQITSSDAQAVKAMLRLYEYQTDEEQGRGVTVEYNGVGFTGTDADILSSFCKQYLQRGTLSTKQIAIIRKKIGKYAGQLTAHAISNGVWVKRDNVWVVA